MSHWVEKKTNFTDIETLKEACALLGLALSEDESARGWSGDRIKADYVIKLKGKYDVALVKSDNGWDIKADWYDGSVEKAIGKEGNLLKQAYTAAAAMKVAHLQGHNIEMQRIDNGDIKLVVKVGAS